METDFPIYLYVLGFLGTIFVLMAVIVRLLEVFIFRFFNDDE